MIRKNRNEGPIILRSGYNQSTVTSYTVYNEKFTLTIFFFLFAGLITPIFSIALPVFTIRAEDIAALTLAAFAFLRASHSATISLHRLVFPLALLGLILLGIVLARFSSIDSDISVVLRAFGVVVFSLALSEILHLSSRQYQSLMKTICFIGAVTSTVVIVMVFLSGSFSSPYETRLLLSSYITVHSNTLSAVSYLLVVLATTGYIVTKTRLYLMYIAVFVFFLIILFTRREIAGLVAAAAYLLLVKGIGLKSKFLLIAAGGSILLLAVLIWGNTFVERTFFAHKNWDSTAAGRDIIWNAALNAIKSNLFGYGMGTEAAVLGAFGAFGETNSHNSYLSVLIELGLIGLVGFIVILSYVWSRCEHILLKSLLIWLIVSSLFGAGLYFYKIQWVALVLIFLFSQKFGDRSSAYRNPVRGK